MILTFILRSDCRSGINNRRIGKLGCMISLLYASKALTPHFNRFLGVDPGLLIFKFGNRLCKTKPKTFPFSAGKHFWFRQCLLENLRHFHCGTSLHSSGLSSHHEEQNSRESPESTCVQQHAWNFSSSPGSWRPPSSVAGLCPSLELHSFLEFQRGDCYKAIPHPALLMGPGKTDHYRL